MIGNDANRAVAVYKTNHTIMYRGSKMAPTTCRAYAHEVSVLANQLISKKLDRFKN